MQSLDIAYASTRKENIMVCGGLQVIVISSLYVTISRTKPHSSICDVYFVYGHVEISRFYVLLLIFIVFSVRCVRYNKSSRCCHDDRPSVRLSDQTLHFSTDLSSRLHSSMSWAPWHQSISTYSQLSFSSSIWKRGGVWMCKLGVISQERLKIEGKLLLSANRKSCRIDWDNNG